MKQAPFVAGVPEKPHGANYYPAGATKEEVEAWIAGLGPEAKSAAIGFFTTIRRDAAGKLQAVPYSVEYQGELAEMAKHLLRRRVGDDASRRSRPSSNRAPPLSCRTTTTRATWTG